MTKLSLKLLALGLFSLVSLEASAAAMDIVGDGKKLEALMDKTPADMSTSSEQSANAQFAIVKKSATFVHKALSQKQLSDEAIGAVARILVRGYFYDQNGDIPADSMGLLTKYSARIDSAFNDMEKRKLYDHQTLEGVRLTVGLIGEMQENGNDRDPGSSKAAPVKAPAKSPAKKKAEVNEGAQLTPCDMGLCNETSTLSTSASKSLIRIPGGV